jgi:hypothetical protein
MCDSESASNRKGVEFCCKNCFFVAKGGVEEGLKGEILEKMAEFFVGRRVFPKLVSKRVVKRVTRLGSYRVLLKARRIRRLENTS